jgi:2-dehydropantoate 2-reductase
VDGVAFEICAVASAVGYAEHVNKSTVAYQMSRTAARKYPGVQPSMMADMLAGRRMEVDAVLGEILRLSKLHNVQCPRLATIYALLSGLDHAFSR